MNICKQKDAVTPFVAGHLYKVRHPSTPAAGQICIYTTSNKMVRLSTGCSSVAAENPSLWDDVTKQYCLTKVDTK